jgi:hypothetical protein
MVQKLENIFLNILRLVVLISATIALLVFLGGLFMGVKGILPGGSDKEANPSVSESSILEKFKKGEPKQVSDSYSSSTENSSSSSIVEPEDPNMKYYTRTANAMITYIHKASEGRESVDKDRLIGVLKNIAKEQKSNSLVTKYISSLADSSEKILTNQIMIDAAKSSSAITVVQKFIETYTKEFNEQIEEMENENERRRYKNNSDQENAKYYFMVGGGAFLAFLFIVFLSIIIKIERNLRRDSTN